MTTADQRFKYFPFVTGDTGQPPPGCETLTLPIPRQWWQTNAMKVRWGDLSPGELISAVVSGLNGIWTCALVQGLYIQLERVYADGIEEWEELHPNTVPEDELLLGFYLHMTGPFSDLVAFSAELKSLIEKASTCRTQLNSRRDPVPIAGSLVRITERTVWRAVQYCQQGGHVVHPTIEALFVEGSFREWVHSDEKNKHNILYLLHRAQQGEFQRHPLNPFHSAVEWQKLSYGSGPSHQAVQRGFVLRFDMAALTPWEKQNRLKMLVGLDGLLAGDFLLPQYRPSKHEIGFLQKEMGHTPGAGTVHDQCPIYWNEFYHGNRDASAGGDYRIGTTYIPPYIPRVPGKTNQFREDMLNVLLEQYGPQTIYGLMVRNSLDELEHRRFRDVEQVLKKYGKGIKPMFRLSEDRSCPPNVVPVLAEVLDYIGANDEADVYAQELSSIEGLDPICAILHGHINCVFREYRQNTSRQALLSIYMLVTQMTVLLPNKLGANMLVIGPPQSGKSDCTTYVRNLLGPIGTTEDLSTEASAKYQGEGAANHDCRMVAEDEGDKDRSHNAKMMRQTADESGTVSTTCMTPITNKLGEREGFRKQKTTVAIRSSRVVTCNQATLSEAQTSRVLYTILERVNTDDNQVRRDAVPHEDQEEAFRGLQDVILRAIGRNSAWEHFGVANKPWDSEITGLYCRLAREHFIVYSPRQIRRIQNFAIGVQCLLLDLYLNRLPMWGEEEMSEERKAIIYMCNRFCNPQGLLIGASLYNSLTGDTMHFSQFISAAKMLASVSGGIVTANRYVKLEVTATNKKEHTKDRFIKQVSKVGIEFGFNPGIEYLKKALEQANDTTGVPKIKEDDDAWWMHEDLFNEYPSFAESILLDAVREVLDKEPEGADKRVPFPREGQNLQSEDYIIVGDIVQAVVEATDPRAGPAVGAARKMGRSHQDHAKLTLAHTQKNGRSVWCPVKQNTPITSATMVRLNPGEEPLKDAIASRVYPGWQLVKRKTPVHDAVLVLRDFIYSQKKHDDPIMEIAPYFLSACGDYTGNLRMVAFDRDADPVGVTLKEDDPYKFSVANPNFKAQGGSKNGFKASTMIRSNPLARRQRFPMKQGQARLFYDKTSKIEEQTFVDLAVALGVDRAEAIIMSKRFTVSAMMKRAEGLHASPVAPAEALPQPEPVATNYVVQTAFPRTTSDAEESFPEDDEAGEVGDLFGTAAAAVPRETLEDLDLVVQSGETTKPNKKKRKKKRSEFVDDECGASGGSSDEEVASETESDRLFVHDDPLSSDEEGMHARLNFDADEEPMQPSEAEEGVCLESTDDEGEERPMQKKACIEDSSDEE